MLWHKYDAHVASLYFIFFIYVMLFFIRPSALSILDFIFEFFKYLSRQDSNYECIILAYMQHSQPHMTLYCAGICFNWGENSEHNVESLIIILSSSSLASLRTPSLGSLTRLLFTQTPEVIILELVEVISDHLTQLWYNN